MIFYTDKREFELVTRSVLTTGLGGLTETVPKLGGSGGGPGVLGGWGLGNVCLLQMHSNAILGPHPGPSPELSKTPSCPRTLQRRPLVDEKSTE